MKLFYHDGKHELVHDELDLGNLKDDQVELVEKVLNFLEHTQITDGLYKNLVLAESYNTISDENDFWTIEFNF